jgi:hypothetical protein
MADWIELPGFPRTYPSFCAFVTTSARLVDGRRQTKDGKAVLIPGTKASPRSSATPRSSPSGRAAPTSSLSTCSPRRVPSPNRHGKGGEIVFPLRRGERRLLTMHEIVARTYVGYRYGLAHVITAAWLPDAAAPTLTVH